MAADNPLLHALGLPLPEGAGLGGMAPRTDGPAALAGNPLRHLLGLDDSTPEQPPHDEDKASELESADPEERAAAARDAIAYWAEELRQAGDARTADAVLKALPPPRPRHRPPDVRESEETNASVLRVLELMSSEPQLKFHGACKRVCPADIPLATFMARIDRSIRSQVGIPAAKLKRES